MRSRRRAGCRLGLPHHAGLAEAYLDRIDALVVTGGAFDVDPALYGGASSHARDRGSEGRANGRPSWR